MRYGVAIPQANIFAEPGAVRAIGRAAEELGFDSVWVSDHIIVPEGSSYIPETMYEPLALLAWLAAETRHVVIGTSVLIAPYRNPVFTAKFLSTVDHLSEGRLVVGVGAGWLKEEFDALGVPFDERGPRTDEALRVFRNLWGTETSSFEGRWTRYSRMRMFPKGSPNRRGTIPILVGGNGAPSIRRAAELGDGWHPINLGLEEFREGVARYRSACERLGRQPGPVVLRHMPGGRTRPSGERWPFTGAPDQVAADIRAYAAAGLDELMLSTFSRSVGEYIAELRRFAREVMPRV
ncbi:F420-dependent hydroxymycolic acid dehydrogenase [bacterium HR29]|jgi:probable F420-dependent oxidoreductase|nr:F420-dependent hydroxymycolic acid dehydrogenase [bacterium HR29]